MSKQCCEYHDNIDYDGIECGLSGSGNAFVCCVNCPEVAWYEKNQPTRPIDFYKEMNES